MCMFLVTSPRCQEAEKTGSQLLGIVRRPETRPAPKNFPEWNYFRFSSTNPRIETWLRALESVRKILKPLKLDKIKVVAGLVFSALSCAWPEGPIGFVLMLQPLSPTPWQLMSPQPSRSLSNWKALGRLMAAREWDTNDQERLHPFYSSLESLRKATVEGKQTTSIILKQNLENEDSGFLWNWITISTLDNK